MHTRLLLLGFLLAGTVHAQKTSQEYPIPEYNNEIYLFQKDSVKLVRLEKGTSRLDTKTKMGGMGGMETSYSMDDEKSPVRLSSGSNLCFILYTGKTAGISSSPQMDSAMKANGMNASQMSDMMNMMNDPASTTSLYTADPGDNKRKIITQSSQGMKILGKAKKPSKKYTLSIKKVKDSYYEIVVDKTLPKGEYSFVVMDMAGGDMSYKLFAFAVD